MKTWAKSWTRVWWASKAVVRTSRFSRISCAQLLSLKTSATDWSWSDGGFIVMDLRFEI